MSSQAKKATKDSPEKSPNGWMTCSMNSATPMTRRSAAAGSPRLNGRTEHFRKIGTQRSSVRSRKPLQVSGGEHPLAEGDSCWCCRCWRCGGDFLCAQFSSFVGCPIFWLWSGLRCFWQRKRQMLNTYCSIPINTRGTAGTPRPWRSTFSRSLS